MVSTTLGEFPAEAFEELTEPELQKFFEVAPLVGTALEEAGFDEGELVLDGGDVGRLVGQLVDSMGSVPGVRAALARGGSSWPEFRATLYRVVTASALVMAGMADELVGELAGAAGGDAPKNGTAPERPDANDLLFGGRVPRSNLELLNRHREQLETLKSLLP